MPTSPATSAALNRHLREFHPLDRVGGAGGLLGAHTHPKESIPTVLVAAFDSREEVKNMADLVCSGADDQGEMIEAIVLANTGGIQTGRVLLSEGNFFVEPGFISYSGNFVFEGMGILSTFIHNEGIGTTDIQNPLFDVETDAELSNMAFVTTTDYVGDVIRADYGKVHNVYHAGSAQSFIRFTGGFTAHHDLIANGSYDVGGFWIDGMDNGTLTDLMRIGSGLGPMMYIEDTNGTALDISNLMCSMSSVHPGIRMKNGTDVTMSNINIKVAATQSAIEVDDGNPFGLQIHGANLAGGYGIRTLAQGDSIGACVLTNLFIQPSISGISARFGGLVMSGVYVGGFSDGTGTGVEIRWSQSQAPIIIDGLRVDKFDGHGVHFLGPGGLARPQSLIASNIYVDEIGKHGILLEDVQQGKLHHSEVKLVSEETSNLYDAIHVTGEAIDVALDHNKIHALATTRYGIHVQSGQGAIVVGNDYGVEADYGTAPFADGAAGTVITYPADPTFGDNFVAVSGGDLTIDIVDGVGVTEEIELGFKIVDEDVGVTDTITHSAPVVERSVTEAVGVTDEVQNIETKAFTETVGVTDSVTPVLT